MLENKATVINVKIYALLASVHRQTTATTIKYTAAYTLLLFLFINTIVVFRINPMSKLEESKYMFKICYNNQDGAIFLKTRKQRANLYIFPPKYGNYRDTW